MIYTICICVLYINKMFFEFGGKFPLIKTQQMN